MNREEELAERRALAERPEPSLALLYGRRRMGKTFLLSRAWADRRHLYYLAADSTQRANRGEFVREMARWSGQDLREADFPSWRTIFRFAAPRSASWSGSARATRRSTDGLAGQRAYARSTT